MIMTNSHQPRIQLVMHEFTDGCQGQYKLQHCMGDVGYGCGDFWYHQVIRNYFETSHVKR